MPEAAPETRYRRGHQKAGDDGVAEFLTLFPGWYGIYAQAGGERATMRLARSGDGYRGTITLGVAT